MKENTLINIIIAVLFLVVAALIAFRLTRYFGFYLEFSVPWYVIVILSAAGAAMLLFWPVKSRRGDGDSDELENY